MRDPRPAPPGRDPALGRPRVRWSNRRRALLLWVLRLLVLALVFFVGLVVGRAVEETPRPGGMQTLVRTLEPDTLRPEPRTVTVTTSAE